MTDWAIRQIFVEGQSMEAQKRCSGWSSIAKFFGTDMGLKNSQMALELMGRPDCVTTAARKNSCAIRSCCKFMKAPIS